MRVILDECLPRKLGRYLVNHEVKTVQAMGWSSFTNGELLSKIDGHFDVFLTIDTSLFFQQNIEKLPFALVTLRANTNQLEDLEPLVPNILKALEDIQAGQVVKIGV